VIVLVHKNKKKPGDGTITFPDLQCWNPQTLVATIIAEIDGDRINCRIKVSDMKKAFSIDDENPMKSITQNRKYLEKVSKRLIEQNRFEKDGSIKINSLDLEQQL
jgi:hypothetical protein